MLSSWLNVLLVFVPVGLGLFLSNASPILVFVFNGIAIIPLSALLTGATEKIASDAGDTIGAFLNISLGNLVELILFVALKHNQIHVVQASILGSMLVNLLPILGTALCVNGLWHEDPVLNTTETQLLSCLLFVSVFVFLIPPSKSIMERLIPVMILIISSGLMSMCAEFLVSTIDEVTHQGHLSESVIGLIILPIVGNVAEYVTVVTVASREKLDLAIAVAVGSSIQIALCVAPLTVIAGWILSRDLSLSFTLFEVAALMGTALLVNLLILSDGNSVLRTSGLKGGLMCACYAIIG
ncbi:hypothetical protein N0V92_002050, partial [Colletotrichum tropicale]